LRRLALLCSCAPVLLRLPAIVSPMLDWLCNLRLCGNARSNSPLLLFALLPFPSFHFYFDLQLTEISIDPAVLIRCYPFAEIAIPQHFATRHNISWGPNPSSVPARVYCDSPRTRQTESHGQRPLPVPDVFILGGLAGLPTGRYRSQPWRPQMATRPCRGLPPASYLPVT
jgi:hypothetical protein